MGKGLPRSTGRGVPGKQDIIKQIIKVRALNVVITDPGAANAGATAVLGDFPEGNILFLGAVANLKLTKNDPDLTDTFTGNIALGTAPTADATLSGGEVDLIPSTAITAAVAGVSATKRYVSGQTESGFIFDNTDGSLEINLNMFIADAAIAANAAVLVDGEVYLSYVVLGDD